MSSLSIDIKKNVLTKIIVSNFMERKYKKYFSLKKWYCYQSLYNLYVIIYQNMVYEYVKRNKYFAKKLISIADY